MPKVLTGTAKTFLRLKYFRMSLKSRFELWILHGRQVSSDTPALPVPFCLISSRIVRSVCNHSKGPQLLFISCCFTESQKSAWKPLHQVSFIQSAQQQLKSLICCYWSVMICFVFGFDEASIINLSFLFTFAILLRAQQCSNRARRDVL